MLTLAFNIQPVVTGLSPLTVPDESEVMQGTINLGSQEPPQTEWNKTYGGTGDDEAYSLVQTSDGGYALAGYTLSYGAGSEDFWLIKTDAEGNILWNRTYGGTSRDLASSAVQTSDGGYALAGGTGTYAYDWHIEFIKTDSAGNAMWNKTYEGMGYAHAYSLIQTVDEGYAMAGYTASYGGIDDSLLVKTDAEGNILWNRTYGGIGQDGVTSVVRASDGGYALAGYTLSYGAGSADFWLIKTDSNGNMQWNKTYGGTSSDVAWSAIQTSDEGYALTGYTESFGAGRIDFWLVKTDAAGNALWNKTYGGELWDRANSVIQTSDGGYAMAGQTWIAGSCDFWLVKTDVAGNVQWNKTYGGPSYDLAWSMVQTSDGGYAMIGDTDSYGAGSYDFWLVKIAASAPAPPDLSIEHVEVSTYSPQEGQPVDINVTIRNIGGSNSGYGNVTLFQYSCYDLPIINSSCITWVEPLPSIPVNTCRAVQFRWNATEIFNKYNSPLVIWLNTPLDPNPLNDMVCLDNFSITGTGGFHAHIDGYSFPNWGPDSPEDMKATELAIRSCIEESLHTIFPAWSPVLARILAYILSQVLSKYSEGGHCYGMAATSVLYYLNSTLKPVSKDTFQMFKNETISNIELYFIQQVFHVLNYLVKEGMGLLGITSLRDQYAKILESIEAGKPLMLLLLTSVGRHAVTVSNAYNVSENLKNVVVYDNNFPGMGIVYTFDLGKGKVYSPTYEIANVFADSPASYYPSDLLAKIIGDFCDNILVTFKRILTFHSPVNVTISDQLNRTISDSLNEIPDATFEYSNLTDERVFYLPLYSSYSVELKGYDTGNCTVTQFVPMANQSASSSIIEFNVNASTKARFELPSESANFTLQVDGNGDGIVDEESTPELASFAQYVSLTNATVPKTYVGRDACLPINVTVANPSNYTLTFNVTLYVNSSAVQTKTITLSNCTSHTIDFTWNTTGFTYGNYDILAAADNIAGETNTADNNLTVGRVTVTIPGDVTGDTWVDMQDISILIDNFLVGAPAWNPNCDVNNDLIIDMADISIAIDHFMQT
jgi:hypothetical protein